MSAALHLGTYIKSKTFLPNVYFSVDCYRFSNNFIAYLIPSILTHFTSVVFHWRHVIVFSRVFAYFFRQWTFKAIPNVRPDGDHGENCHAFIVFIWCYPRSLEKYLNNKQVF